MSNSEYLLDQIEKGVVEHGGDLGGWTRLDGNVLQLFDGRVTLCVEEKDTEVAAPGNAIHAHVLATLHEYDDEVLDACLIGMGDNTEAALSEISVIWITCVAGPIKSFLENKPICMSCQAGVAGGDTSQGYSPGDYGLSGLRAFVGPSFVRGFRDGGDPSTLDDTKPWFRYASESAAPRRVHLAKSSIASKGAEGWSRDLEIDGHDVSHHDPDWPAGVRSSDYGYLVRFAVFEFPQNSAEIQRRAELERTIRHFAEQFTLHESADQLMDAMAAQGFDPDLVHEAESFSTIAFGRTLFEQLGVQYSPTIIRARQDGRCEASVPLMSIPAYSRGRALAAQFRETMPHDDFESLCLYSAESNAILQALEANGDNLDLAQMTMHPCVVPDRNVSHQTMDAAFALLNDFVEQSRPTKNKPWWKFW